jgi:purine-nucleoside phosphorylase
MSTEHLWTNLLADLRFMRSAAKKKKKESTTVQTLIFSKKHFTKSEAKAWAKSHDYKSSGVDETEKSYRIRQRDPGDFKKDSLRTIKMTTGVQAVVGHLN